MQIAKQHNLTRGNAAKNLWDFMLPYLVTYLIQALYSTADLFVLGKFGSGAISVAAVTNGMIIMWLVLGIVMGFTTGITVLIGQYYGAGNRKQLKRCIGSSISAYMIFAIVYTAIMLMFIPYILRIMGVPEDAFAETLIYTNICSLGIVFITGYNIFAAIFRGIGNSKVPLVIVAIACSINIILNFILIAWLGYGIGAAAIGTVFSQALSMFLMLWFMTKTNIGFSFKKRNFIIDKKILNELLRIGVPISATEVSSALAFTFVQTVINGMGLAAAAGAGIVTRISLFVWLPAFAFMGSVSAITAQSIGAKKPQRAVVTLGLGIYWTTAFGICVFILQMLFAEEVISLFIGQGTDRAEEAVQAGVMYMRGIAWDYILFSILCCLNGFFNGCRRTFFTMINNVFVAGLVIVPLTYIFSRLPGTSLYLMGFICPITSAVSIVIAGIYFYSGRWKPKRLSKKDIRAAEVTLPVRK
ncbi:MAG: MATE family efflux transporter [Alphaproteobacteria bacterium]|nr:MATE family efflux transporter [Alphaproteobacteria bacterium]